MRLRTIASALALTMAMPAVAHAAPVISPLPFKEKTAAGTGVLL